MTLQYFEIGATYAGRVNVENMTSIAPNMSPKARYDAYAESVPVGSGGRQSRGSPAIIWQWGFIYYDMFNALRAICPGASANVIIRSRLESGDADSAGAYSYYSAVMIWPELDSYEYIGGRGIYQPFEIRFEQVTAYTP